METTPGYPEHAKLPNAPKEVGQITAALEAACDIIQYVQPPPRMAEAIAGIRTCSLAHFACHARAATNPTKSELYFWDNHRDHLRVERLMTIEMAHCSLAYLSACESALNTDQCLREEGLRLAGALQMAGIPSVVATWWSILDDKAVDVANAFYKTLNPPGSSFVVDGCKAARSSHAVAMKLRTTEIDPFVWDLTYTTAVDPSIAMLALPISNEQTTNKEDD